MVSNVESDKARKEKLRRCREHDTLQRERKNNEATLTELGGKSFGISMLPRVRQCTCIFYSSYYHTAVAILKV